MGVGAVILVKAEELTYMSPPKSMTLEMIRANIKSTAGHTQEVERWQRHRLASKLFKDRVQNSHEIPVISSVP